ncbi:MAG: hypothetical protein R8M45_10670 [Ghiorsea sp.]
MNFEQWIAHLTKTDGGVNTQLLIVKQNAENIDHLKSLTSELHKSTTICNRARFLVSDIKLGKCVCGNVTKCVCKKGTGFAFTPFCSVKCSNHAKSVHHNKPVWNPKDIYEYMDRAFNNNKFIGVYCDIKTLKKYGVYEEFVKLSSTIKTKNVPVSKALRYIKDGYTSHPECVVCGKPAKIIKCLGNNDYNLFYDTCSTTCASRNPERNAKIKKTCLERYGVETYVQTEENRAKVLKKLKGVPKDSKFAEKMKLASQHRHWSDEAIAIMGDRDLFIAKMEEWQNPVVVSYKLGVSHTSIIKYSKKYGVHSKYFGKFGLYGKSKGEQELYDFIMSSYPDKVVRNTRDIVAPKEIDTYLPDINVAFEFNGVYWHGEERGKGRNYHVDKTDTCEAKGIQLYHIWDNEWNDPNKQAIWKSMIRNRMGLSERIYARNCTMVIVETADRNDFLNSNHLQGADRAKVSLGLLHKDKLVAVMSFCIPRFNKKYDWELSRFCCLNGMTIVGGASKLLTNFRRQYSGSIISYANRRWSTGNLYAKLGFDELEPSKPNYFYTKDHEELFSRNKFQKHKLESQLNIFDANLTEKVNMQINGYDRIWDCGNRVFAMLK